MNRLLRELFRGKKKYSLKAVDIFRITNHQNVWYAFFTINDKPVGMAGLYVVELFSRKLGVIEEVVVLKKYRKQGIGAQMVKKLIAIALKQGADCVELTYRLSDTKTRDFYRRMGFKSRKNGSMRLILNKQHFVV